MSAKLKIFFHRSSPKIDKSLSPRLCEPFIFRTLRRNVATTSRSCRLATGKLRRFRVKYLVVQFQPLKRCGLCRIEPELLGLLAEEIALFGIVVEAVHFHFLAPAFDFFPRFLFAALIH